MDSSLPAIGPAGQTHAGWVGRIALAAAVAGALDAAFSFVAYVLVAGRYNFETLLQYIATGLLGDHAYQSGVAGIATAALGVVGHFALAAGFTAAFALAAWRWRPAPAMTVAAGLLFGGAVWILMANAVLPGLGVVHEPIGGRYWWAFLVDHALFVGLPIALLTTWPAERRMTTGRTVPCVLTSS